MSLVATAVLATAFPKNSRPLIGHVFPGITTIEECQKLFGSRANKWIVHGTHYVLTIDGSQTVKNRKGRLMESLEISYASPRTLLDLMGAKATVVTMAALGAGIIDLRWLGRNRRTVSSALSLRKMKPRITPNAYLLSVPITGNPDFKRYQIELQFTKDSMTAIRVNLTK